MMENRGQANPFDVAKESNPFATKCSSCTREMERHDFERNTSGTVSLDICFHCQGIWFDGTESAQLAPKGVLDLFQLISSRKEPVNSWKPRMHCPRCIGILEKSEDLTKNGRFAYHSCSRGHGRFTSFSAFMSEKGFVRQLAPKEIEELAKQVHNIRCSGCGAPVDIRKEVTCSHCHSPIVVLDNEAVAKTMQTLIIKDKQLKDPHINAEAMADMLIAKEREHARIEREKKGYLLTSKPEDVVADLLMSGIGFIINKLFK